MPWDRPTSPLPGPNQPESLIDAIAAEQEVSWARDAALGPAALDPEIVHAVHDADQRLERFAPWVAQHYPETTQLPIASEFRDGIIESPVEECLETQRYLSSLMGRDLPGSMWLKRDDVLPVSGSIKARGGIHEVFRLAEETTPAQTSLSVASTGNLGLSIGTIGPELGFSTQVHMSIDAKQWKKDLLRSRGADVVEHPGLFTDTVAAARQAASESGSTFFIDDENSLGLFAGYAVAGQRLKRQFDALGKQFAPEAPLIVYLPCGVGGGPGGVTFGLKMAFGDAVQCHFIEPAASPCMTLAIASGDANTSCADYGLSGRTVADGLAVQKPSPLVVEYASHLISGFHTLDDVSLLASVNLLERTTGIVAEPSAVAGLTIPWRFPDEALPDNATHLIWLTGGALIPDQDRERLRGQAATAALQYRGRI